MIAYEFYLHNPVKGYELVGILPERRKNSERITQESIMRWGKNIFSNELNAKDIYFIQVTINEDTGNIFRPTPFLVVKEKVTK
jgi:hypothetical protein